MHGLGIQDGSDATIETLKDGRTPYLEAGSGPRRGMFIRGHKQCCTIATETGQYNHCISFCLILPKSDFHWDVEGSFYKMCWLKHSNWCHRQLQWLWMPMIHVYHRYQRIERPRMGYPNHNFCTSVVRMTPARRILANLRWEENTNYPEYQNPPSEVPKPFHHTEATGELLAGGRVD
jgi:hypothetical protein